MLTLITPPPLLPSSNAKKAGGRPIALPEKNNCAFLFAVGSRFLCKVIFPQSGTN